MKTVSALLVPLCMAVACGAQAQKTAYKAIGKSTVYQVASMGVYIVASGMTIDADGAPKAYHKNDKIALDYLANAGTPGHYYGIVTDAKGNPAVQSPSNPAPGYYVSTTSLEDPAKKTMDPARYVNAAAVPYIAIPSRSYFAGFMLGDIVLVVNKANGRRCYAIAADIGSKKRFGEGSIYLAAQLGVPGTAKSGGVEDNTHNIVYIMIKNSGDGHVLTNAQIVQMGSAKLSDSDIDELLR